ncbi:TPA: hypothetical protein ACX6PV_003829 [Photobacterium damselae]
MFDSINNSIGLLKRLKEISDNVADAEFKNVLADLSNELADVKIELADSKEKLAELKEENRILKQTSVPVEEKPLGLKLGCYQFQDDSGLYCTACWDSNRKKSITHRMNSRVRICNVCKASLFP